MSEWFNWLEEKMEKMKEERSWAAEFTNRLKNGLIL